MALRPEYRAKQQCVLPVARVRQVLREIQDAARRPGTKQTLPGDGAQDGGGYGLDHGRQPLSQHADAAAGDRLQEASGFASAMHVYRPPLPPWQAMSPGGAEPIGPI